MLNKKNLSIILILISLCLVSIILLMFYYSTNDLQSINSSWPYNTINFVKVNNIKPHPLKIAIIDTGIDLDQKCFDGLNITYFKVSDTLDNDNKHGTMVTGTICCSNFIRNGKFNLLKNSDIYVIDIGSDSNISANSLVKGINTALDLKSDIISISVGLYKENKELEIAIEKAIKMGILVICSSGNDCTKQYLYPASYKDVISVAAVDNQNNYLINHNFNDRILVSAPGYEIPTNIYDLTSKKYLTINGTSASTAFLTSLIIVLKNIDPDLTTNELLNIIKKTSKDIGDQGKDNDYGYGLINFKGAVIYNRNPIVYIIGKYLNIL